jgi:hypothetical protein
MTLLTAAALLMTLAISVQLIKLMEGARTDGNGIQLSRYDGVFGVAGSRVFIQLTYIDGWVFFHSVNPIEGEICGIARDTSTGLGVSTLAIGDLELLTHGTIRRAISLSHDGKFLLAYGNKYPRRSSYQSSIDAMWNFDGKSSTLQSCKPTPWVNANLLLLAIGGSK